MNDENLRDIERFLMDLHFIQATAIVAVQLQDNKKAIDYMRRIAHVREIIKTKLKETK